ncbi:hypothetical protein [Gimesia aquarii]|uniref:Uncharacterized protein n=1 Tax=Gimesia aquarii TaxID=2527964 RepID=A0A517VPZ1_9PLAN|nr:hypothetical protein [Gimesia aquarii]QDT95053.1 hypothetical protein V144x_04870 [Gimesia aquarii]
MSIEVVCPACGGAIQIEDVSEVVECPLCQMHLQVDPETNEPVLITEDLDEVTNEEPEGTLADSETSSNESDISTDLNTNQEETEVNGSQSEAEEDLENGDSESTPEEVETESPFAFLPGGNNGTSDKNQTVREATNFSFLPGGNDDSENAENDSTVITSEMPSVDEEEETDSTEEVVSTEQAESVNPEATTETTTSKESPPEETTTTEETIEAGSEPETPEVQQEYRKQKVVSRRLFTLTLTYAIAATIMVALLLYAKYLGDPHQLESLPDLKPPVKNDEIALQLVPEHATLPAGHTLKLGGPGRRFGNIKVTPLRVTRGPIEFEHYTGDTTKTRPPTEDVLKLYLRFENVSDDQTFEPLDQKLLLTRVPGKTPDSHLRANNFVSRVDQKKTNGERVLVYDMPPSWEWNLKGQNINQEAKPQNLKPGQSFETYVATDEAGIDSLKGDLVWRLQMRKGYHPESHRGVTTLIEVVFNSDQIQPEKPSENKESLPTS